MAAADINAKVTKKIRLSLITFVHKSSKIVELVSHYIYIIPLKDN